MGSCYSCASRTPINYLRPSTPNVSFQQPKSADGNRHVVELAVHQIYSSREPSAFTSVTPGTSIPRPTLKIPPEQPI